MANLPLVAGVVVSVNSVPVTTTTKVSLKRSRSVTQKYGPFGAIGSATGPFKFQGQLEFAVPLAGMEIDIDALAASPTGFSINFSKGAMRYLATGCFIADDSLDNDPEAAQTSNSVSIVATEVIRTA